MLSACCGVVGKGGGRGCCCVGSTFILLHWYYFLSRAAIWQRTLSLSSDMSIHFARVNWYSNSKRIMWFLYHPGLSYAGQLGKLGINCVGLVQGISSGHCFLSGFSDILALIILKEVAFTCVNECQAVGLLCHFAVTPAKVCHEDEWFESDDAHLIPSRSSARPNLSPKILQ